MTCNSNLSLHFPADLENRHVGRSVTQNCKETTLKVSNTVKRMPPIFIKHNTYEK